MAEVNHEPFAFEVLISGTDSMLDRVREITGFAKPGCSGAFSFDRIIPRPLCIEGTTMSRGEFADRFHREILEPYELLVSDFGGVVEFQRHAMTRLLDSACRDIWNLGFASDRPIRDWMFENWGTTANVEPPDKQGYGLTDSWVGNRIHARLYIDGASFTPPLPVFDALARMVPGIKIALAWSSESVYVMGEATGLATWRNGAQTGWTDSKLFDSDEPFGALRSLRPLRMARWIREAGFEETRCVPTLRWNLTSAALEALMNDETITIPIGPAHEATVGSDRNADFHVTRAGMVDGEDLYWHYGIIRDDEAWHRVRGQVGGMSVALSLHSPEVVEANRHATMREAGADSMQTWIKERWEW